MKTPRGLHWLKWLAMIPLWWAVYYLATVFISRISKAMTYLGMMDFPIFVHYAREFIANGHLYDVNGGLYGPGAPIYKFPPLMGAVLVQSIQNGASEETLFFWAGMTQVMAYACALILCLLALPTRRLWLSLPVTVALALAYAPLLEDNLLRLQLEPYLLLMFAAALYSLRHQRNFFAGIMVGLAAMLKIYPAIFGLYFLLTRRWAALAGMTAAGIAVSAYTLFVLGTGENVRFFTELLPVMLREFPCTSLENIGIGNLAMFFGASHMQAKTITRLALGLSLALSVWLVFRTHRPQNTPATQTALEFSAFVLVALLGMANSWWNYQLLALIPVYSIVAVLAGNLRSNLIILPVFAIACAMLWLTSHIQWREALLVDMPVFWREVFFRGIATWLIFFTVITLRINLDTGVTRPPG